MDFTISTHFGIDKLESDCADFLYNFCSYSEMEFDSSAEYLQIIIKHSGNFSNMTKRKRYFLSADKHYLINVLTLAWNEFKGIGDKVFIVANYAT